MLTIVAPTATRALTTVAAVESELGVTGQDALITEFILRASAMVETFCGRSVALERVRETSPCALRGGAGIALTRWPIVEIHSVTANGVELATDRYHVDHGILTGAFGNVVVEYTAGYVLPGEEGRTLPHDIERVVVALVKMDWHGRNRDQSIRTETVEDLGNFTYFGSGSAVDAVTAPLGPYRMPVAL